MKKEQMKPNRIAKFLAKILGEPEGENIRPSNAVEYYLNEMAENGSGGAMYIYATKGVFNSPVSYNDILAAVQANKVVLLVNVKEGARLIWPLYSYDKGDQGCGVAFGDDDKWWSAQTADDPLQPAT